MHLFAGRTWAMAAALGLAAAAVRADEPARKDEPAPQDGPAVAAASAKDGFTIQSEDGAFKLRIGGYAQADARFYLGDESEDAVDTFVLRRVRPGLSGTLARNFDFALVADFGGGTATVQDAFLDSRFHPAFRVKVGKFKPPVGLERLGSATALLFVERALPTNLVPNREVGLQVHGELGGGTVAYQAGLFNGALDGSSNDGDVNDAKDLEGRLFVQPFRNGASSALKGLGLGIAGTTGKEDGAVPVYRSAGLLTIFSYATGVVADGTRTRLAPQGSYQAGPLRLLGEWTEVKQRLRNAQGATLEARHRAWQAAAAFVLTGEAAVGYVVTPARPFDPSHGGWGALEVAARYDGLDTDPDVFAGFAEATQSVRRARSWGVGLNWYLNRNVKYVVSYHHTTFEGGAAGGGDRPSENALQLRTQVGF